MNRFVSDLDRNEAFVSNREAMNRLINSHELNDEESINEINRLEEVLSGIIKRELVENRSAVGLVLGEGSYGRVYNQRNGTVIKNQNKTDDYFMYKVFKECLIQHTLSLDDVYGHCVPRVRSFTKRLEGRNELPRIMMNKVDNSRYYTFKDFLQELSERGGRVSHKIYIFLKKMIGIARVLNHFQERYGFIHNDFKPDNFYVSRDNSLENIEESSLDIKIIDFWLSAMREGSDNYIINECAILIGCDMIYYSKIGDNDRNYCKSSDFVYLLSFVFTYNHPFVRKIFGGLYDTFYRLFNLSIRISGILYNIDLVQFSNFFTRKYKDYELSKNIEKSRDKLKGIYSDQARKNRYRLNRSDKNEINISIKNFYELFTPENMIVILENFMRTQTINSLITRPPMAAAVATASASTSTTTSRQPSNKGSTSSSSTMEANNFGITSSSSSRPPLHPRTRVPNNGAAVRPNNVRGIAKQVNSPRKNLNSSLTQKSKNIILI